jgi:hypothetical protein
MILYHFCAKQDKDNILKEGITLGQFPQFSNGQYQLIPCCQWLTEESDPKKQSWATQNLIDYSRTAYRLTVNIPGSYHKKLIRAVDFIKDFSEEAQQIVTGWDGSEKWHIYQGKIPAKWVVGCHRMEKAI